MSNQNDKECRRVILPAGSRLILDNTGDREMIICIEDSDSSPVYRICSIEDGTRADCVKDVEEHAEPAAEDVPAERAESVPAERAESVPAERAESVLAELTAVVREQGDTVHEPDRGKDYQEIRRLLQQYPLVYAHEGQSVGNSFFYDFYFYDLTCESSKWLGDSRDLDEESVSRFVSTAAAYMDYESREPDNNDEEFYYAMMFGKKYIFGSHEMEALEAAFIELVHSIHM